MRALLALLLFAGPLLGQAANGWAPIENGWSEVQTSASSLSGLTSGRVTLSTGATSVGDDAGCTWTGTGGTFELTSGFKINSSYFIASSGFATGLTTYLDASGLSLASGNKIAFSSDGTYYGTKDFGFSRYAAGAGIMEDGAGNARDLYVRHNLGAGTAPTVAGNGTTPGTIAGKDSFLKVTVGTGVTTSIVITYGTAYATAPVVVANAQTTTTPINVTSTTTTATLTTAAFTAGEVLHVMSGGF